MCGILAVVSQAPLDSEHFDAALRRLTPRGPEGRNHWLSPDAKIALGHCQLSLVGHGRQPLHNHEQTVVAVVNGEFYGYQSQRAQLQARGHRFATDIDSEVLLPLYEEDRLDCLRGEFAYLLWDRRRRRLLAGRDPYGVKPLYYLHQPGLLALASEAKALLALGHPARWDLEAFSWAAATQYLPCDRGFFQGIRQLPPAAQLRFQNGQLRLLPAPVRHRNGPLEARRNSHVEGPELLEALSAAVDARLQGHAKKCVQLSGGVDSSTVLALAAARGPVTAYTIAFPGVADYDESEQARATAAFLGVDWRPLEFSTQQLREALEPAVVHAEGTAINGHLPARYLLHRQMSREGFKVVLTGEGADEILSGYAHFSPAAFAGEQLHCPRSSGIMLWDEEPPSLMTVEKQLGFVPPFFKAKAVLGSRITSLLSLKPKQDIYAQWAASLPAELSNSHPLEQTGYLWNRSALANYILRTLGDGTESAHGLEGRLPFLDQRVVEVAQRLDPSRRFKDGLEKVLLRQATVGLLPEAVRMRPKQPFMTPGLGETQLDFYAEQLLDFSLLNRPAFLCLLDRLRQAPLSQRKSWDPALMWLTSAAILERHYGLSS